MKYNKLISKRNNMRFNYLKSDLELKQEIIESEDPHFISAIQELLENNEELNNLYKQKEQMREERIKKSVEEAEAEAEDKANDEPDSEQADDNGDNGTDTDADTNNKQETLGEEDEIDEGESDEKDQNLKKLYRQIVKKTHPDRVDDEYLNKLYMEATDYYDSNDIINIYSICDILEIEYEVGEDFEQVMETKLKSVSNQINNIEQTYTWQWYNAKDDNARMRVLMSFITMRLQQP